MRENVERLANESMHLCRSSGCKIARLLVLLLAVLSISGALRLLSADATADARASKKTQPGLARMSERVSVRADRRGNPWISLSDGHDLLTAYAGQQETIDTLDGNRAQPLSLGSADFDEDGVADLICGYSARGGGVVTLLRGNGDALYPNAPEANQHRAGGTQTEAPFLSPAFVFGVSEAVDFIGAGDFDGDGHWDVVTAARGSNKLYLLSGDGRGGLLEPRAIDLPGRATTMVVGEMNRRDGLDDVVVGVTGAQGPKALVFEGPEGALRASPESFDLPADATSLALGQLDDSYEMDLAIAAGHDLMIVHGRDRKLSLIEAQQAEVPAGRVNRRFFAAALTSITTGDFTGRGATDIAVLTNDGAIALLRAPAGEKSKSRKSIDNWNMDALDHGAWSDAARLVTARVSSTPVDSLVVVDRATRQLDIVSGNFKGEAGAASLVSPPRARLNSLGSPAAVLPMRLNADALNDLVIMETDYALPVVVTTQPQSVFTVTTTADSGPGSLRQAIINANGGVGADSITFDIPSPGVPTIKPLSPLPAITDVLMIDGSTQPGGKVELDGSNAGVNATALGLVVSAGSSTVRGLVINRFDRSAIKLDTNGDNVIEGCFIGTDSTGTAALPNGVRSTGQFNQKDAALLVSTARNVIGGTTPAARNIISGNAGTGVQINGPGGTFNSLGGNFIGTTSSGTITLGNSHHGVVMSFSSTTLPGATNNTIGGTTAGSGNLISGNGASQGFGGMTLTSPVQNQTSGNLVQGNLIGTDVTGTIGIGNHSFGIAVAAQNNVGSPGTELEFAL